MDIEEKVKLLIESEIEKLGYILSSVKYIKEDGNYYLRVVINKEGIIDIDDCICVTKLIDPMLDSVDYIKDSYILDVCSKEKGCE